MSCWKSKHRCPSLSRKSVRKQSSNLSRRFRGSALVMGTKTATWPTDSQMKTCCTAPNSYGDSTWQFRGVHFGNYNDCPSTGTKKTCVILCQTFVVETSIPLKPLCLGALRVHATVWHPLTSGGRRAGVDGSCMQVKTRSTSLRLIPMPPTW
jgi:hypothetical protein